MKTIQLLVLGLVLLPAEGRPQGMATQDRATLDALVSEVRLLRQAIERQTATAVRGQLLATRLAVQHTRLLRAQDAVDRIADAVDDADRGQEQARQALARVSRLLADVVEEPRRAELEREAETLRAQVADCDREVSRLRTRGYQAEQALRTEQRVHGELEASLAGLDRQPARPGP